MHSMFAVEVNVGESLGPPVHQKSTGVGFKLPTAV